MSLWWLALLFLMLSSPWSLRGENNEVRTCNQSGEAAPVGACVPGAHSRSPFLSLLDMVLQDATHSKRKADESGFSCVSLVQCNECFDMDCRCVCVYVKKAHTFSYKILSSLFIPSYPSHSCSVPFWVHFEIQSLLLHVSRGVAITVASPIPSVIKSALSD